MIKIEKKDTMMRLFCAPFSGQKEDLYIRYRSCFSLTAATVQVGPGLEKHENGKKRKTENEKVAKIETKDTIMWHFWTHSELRAPSLRHKFEEYSFSAHHSYAPLLCAACVHRFCAPLLCAPFVRPLLHRKQIST